MKVLVISGDAEVRRALSALLEDRGDEVTLRTSPRRAFAGRTFDCVMIDLAVGAEVLGLCRQARARDDEAAVVVLSREADVERLGSAFRAGADDFLSLPIDAAMAGGRMRVIDRTREARRKRIALEQALDTSRSRSRTLIESIYDGLVLLDDQGVIAFANTRFSELTGFAGIELIGEHANDVLLTADGRALIDVDTESKDASVRTWTDVLRTKDGTEAKVELTIAPIADENNTNGRVAVMRLLGEDATAQTQAALDRERAFFRQLFQNSPNGIVILDTDDRVVEANEPFYRMFKQRPESVVGQPLTDLIVPEDLRTEALDLSRSVFELHTIERETVRCRSDGTMVDVAILGYPIVLDDQRIGAYGMYTDITARKRAERRLFHEAFHDPLTGLPNRSLLGDRLQRAVAQAERGDNAFALLFVDLDGFKAINDQHGHSIGDQLLVDVAGRLEACLRPGDTTARYGGDEFMILLENLSQSDDVEPIAERVLATMRSPFEVGELTLTTAASIGIAVSSAGFDTEEQMLRAADRAMYRAKTAGKDRFEMASSPKAPGSRTALGDALREGLESDAFHVGLLPIAVVERSRLVGLAVRVSWHHADHGTIAAPALRAIAEQTGQEVEMSRWIIDRTCSILAGWRQRHPDHGGPLVHICLPEAALLRAGFAQELSSVLTAYAVVPATLVLVLPAHLLGGTASRAEALWEVRSIGVRLALEGFGLDDVPIRRLQKLPIDLLRLDARLARDPRPGSDAAETLRTLRRFADSLNMKLVATGIDSAEQIEGLTRSGIHLLQGAGVGRELDADEIERWIAEGELGIPGQPNLFLDPDPSEEDPETEAMVRPTDVEMETPR